MQTDFKLKSILQEIDREIASMRRDYENLLERQRNDDLAEFHSNSAEFHSNSADFHSNSAEFHSNSAEFQSKSAEFQSKSAGPGGTENFRSQREDRKKNLNMEMNGTARYLFWLKFYAKYVYV